MSKMMLAALAVAALGACAKGDRANTAAADSLNRDLQLAPADSTAPLNDAASRTPPAAVTPTATPPAATVPTRRPPVTRPVTTPTPAVTSTRSLAVGADIPATTNREISSKVNKVGEMVTASVTADVKNSAGQVVIPAGSTVNLRITAIHASENKSDSTGTLALAVESVEMGGSTYPLDADIHVTGMLVSHGVAAGDVAKVGVGAGIGAVVGRVLGGKKGTVIGGVLGGAVGAQRAVETKDRDVVVASGTPIRIEVRSKFVATR